MLFKCINEVRKLAMTNLNNRLLEKYGDVRSELWDRMIRVLWSAEVVSLSPVVGGGGVTESCLVSLLNTCLTVLSLHPQARSQRFLGADCSNSNRGHVFFSWLWVRSQSSNDLSLGVRQTASQCQLSGTRNIRVGLIFHILSVSVCDLSKALKAWETWEVCLAC